MQKAFDAGDLIRKKIGMRFGALFFVFVLTLGIDLATKGLFFRPDTISDFFLFSPVFFQLTTFANTGLSFNIPFPARLLAFMGIGFLIFLCVYIIRVWKKMRVVDAVAYGLIFGGAVGNVFDRLVFGFVRDWMLFFERSAVNLADLAIFFGLLLLFLIIPILTSASENGTGYMHGISNPDRIDRRP